MRVLSASDIIFEAKERDFWMYPLFWPGCLSMIYSKPGTGKSLLALWFAATLATAGRFLKYKAEKKIRSLYLDGEMGKDEQLPRLVELGAHISPEDEFFRFITPDACDDYRLPNLASPEGQDEIDSVITKFSTQFLVIDNYNTIISPLPREDEVQTWNRFEKWLIKWRSKGLCILVIHHAGKGGAQLGTSRKEQIMNWIAKLSTPLDYEAEQNARFILSFDKMRHALGLANEPLIISYDTRQSPPWVWERQGSILETQVLEMANAKMSAREIATTLNISLFKVKTLLKRDQIAVEPKTERELMEEWF